MRYTSLRILEERADGCVIGYAEGDSSFVAGIVASDVPGDHAEARRTAEALCRAANSFYKLRKTLRDAQRCLDEAVVATSNTSVTRRWASASEEARLALIEAEDTNSWFDE